MLQVWSRVSLDSRLPNATSWTPRTSRTVSQHACWERAVRSYHLPVVLYIMYMIVCVSTNNSNVGNLAESEYILDYSLCVLELDTLNVIDINLSQLTHPQRKA